MTTIATSTHAKKPEGAPFIVERGDFYPGMHIETAVYSIPEDKFYNWPVVYILSNQNEAYVGQTTSVINRMNQHGANPEKQDFTSVTIIENDEFNASVITDYEHKLIGLMQADGRYRMTNKNEGMNKTNYFSKDQYEAMFEELWSMLRRLELADHTIKEIEESEVFKYSPYKGLTPDQRVALDKIMAVIEQRSDSAKPIVVEGMPGTGKTVLAVYLLKMLKDDPAYKDMNIRIVEPVTSLRNTLRRTLQSVSGLSADDVIAPADVAKPEYGHIGGSEKSFDILLVDEAHRLKQRKNLGTQFGNHDKTCRNLGLDTEASQLDWILAQAKLPIFFYDPLQAIGPSCLNPAHITEKLGTALNHPITLDSQMRVKGGKDYLDHIVAILDGKDPLPKRFPGYTAILHESFTDFVAAFEDDLKEHDLTRMMAGYAYKWVTNKDKSPEAYDIAFEGIKLKWNCTYDNWIGKGLNDPSVAREVGCIHSTQGYDLSYAYVIIGNDIKLDRETGLLVADRANYYDRNGKATASQEELDRYVRNIYYVLLTRGIYGTHIYVENQELREYFSRYFECAPNTKHE